ncbi:leucine-rich repeat-containing protein 58 [Schistocerca nitens]|uniref:leucine-rich repeat-containing protein 58 n=1 Tax=Schistocerca nitens TaxID=7011 RepID=UPI00211805E6|nr:leucine-rich repeat-containing protein 58 [Schistocerca nitens]
MSVYQAVQPEYTTSDSSDADRNVTLDYSRLLLDSDTLMYNLEEYAAKDKKATEDVDTLLLYNNNLDTLPASVSKFTNLKMLDISYNNITHLPEALTECRLTSLIARNNMLENDSFPKSFGALTSLKELNLSGNSLTSFPQQILDLTALKYLYLGSNSITNIPKDVWKLQSLQYLYMGGNKLQEVPASVGKLKNLQALVLCDNLLESLPAAIANLKFLKSLLLHKNRLTVLPPEIVGLNSLAELSLRDNPLVVRFATNMSLDPPTLLELAARTVKLANVTYSPYDLPRTLVHYLDSAHHCVNPHCKGVYFDSRVEHVKFVDFCGKYRIPLMQYLCSSRCISESSPSSASESSEEEACHMVKRVLLG